MNSMLRFLFWMAILVAIVLGVLWGVGVRSKRLPAADPVFTNSLKPTLNEGDLIVTQSVVKPVYGDLVLCPEPGAEQRYIIGRIIGESGDKVVIKDGVPIVNRKRFIREYDCIENIFKYPHPDNEGEVINQQCQWESISGRLHKIGNLLPVVRPEKRVFEVPEEHFFLISDNCQYPYVSRDFGPVPTEDCQTTVLGRLWSKDGWSDSPHRLNYIQ